MNGVFLIDKETGCTSRDVVNEIIKKVETRKVGHTGTLDPLATGVLVICVGKATKLVDMLTCEYKEYEAEIILGLETDTYDITGNIIKEEIPNVKDEDIIDTLTNYIGEYDQEVPIYSAVKVKGKKLYEYARNNEVVILPKRKVMIDDLKLISDIKRNNNRIIFKIWTRVSKGTYIRALVNDISHTLKTVGVMSSLRRTKLGDISIEKCNVLDDITLGSLVPVKEVLKDYPFVYVDNVLKKDILNGKIINNIYNQDKVVFLDESDLVLAIYKIYDKDKSKMKPDIMLGGI